MIRPVAGGPRLWLPGRDTRPNSVAWLPAVAFPSGRPKLLRPREQWNIDFTTLRSGRPQECSFLECPAIRGKQNGAYMRIDLYTKTILTLIVLLLTVIVMKPVLQPQTALADGAFAGIQFSYSGGNHAFFNANTGDVWEYSDRGDFHQNITESVNSVRITGASQPGEAAV